MGRERASGAGGRGRGGRGGGEYNGRGGGRGDRGGGRGKDENISLPSVLWRKEPFREGRERYEMTEFVKAAAGLNHNLKLNEFILQLGSSESVMNKLQQIICFRFDVPTRTFQEIALPLMTLVTTSAFANSPHSTVVKKVYRMFCSNPLFVTLWMRLRNC
uniref:Uncharacterized protein n=1 Tax=Globisporangium ultimum (strain ATCC 200006 / CBS 805.95 / DAOM BR144) TaxID=431595 RepID=K3X2E7_GLOUD